MLNNKGYTIERYLHGKTRKYNDIVNWCVLFIYTRAHADLRGYRRKWTQLLSTLGGEEGVTCQSYTVHNKVELDKLLNDETFAKAEKMQLVEVIMDQFDAPRALKVQAELSGKTNKYAL